MRTARRLLAFALIVLATIVTKWGRSRAVVGPTGAYLTGRF